MNDQVQHDDEAQDSVQNKNSQQDDDTPSWAKWLRRHINGLIVVAGALALLIAAVVTLKDSVRELIDGGISAVDVPDNEVVVDDTCLDFDVECELDRMEKQQ